MGAMRTVLIMVILGSLVAGCVGAPPTPSSTIPSPSEPTATQEPSEPTATQEPSQAPGPEVTAQPEVTLEPAASGGTGVASPAATTVIPDGSPGATPRPTPAATLPSLPLVGLRYSLVDEIGPPLFCDPDYYPVARADEAQLAAERYPSIVADASTYEAIVDHLGVGSSATPTDDEILAIYREWKMLNALSLEPSGDRHRFDYIAATSTPEAGEGWHVSGTIDGGGTIDLALRESSGPPPCPICLARGTAIATPEGPIAVEDLRPGMAVWTADGLGRRLSTLVAAVGSTPVPSTHRVIRLVLADGRTLDASPGHPLADGRRLGELRPGDPLDGSWVASAALVPYAGRETFDLLPSGSGGIYWAGGIPLLSTLRRAP
jgi:hypothetical protein